MHRICVLELEIGFCLSNLTRRQDGWCKKAAGQAAGWDCVSTCGHVCVEQMASVGVAGLSVPCSGAADPKSFS